MGRVYRPAACPLVTGNAPYAVTASRNAPTLASSLAGRVRVVSQFQRADKHRASFAFLDLTERESEMLEGFLIDFALERVGITPP